MEHSENEAPETQPSSKRGIFFILAGLVVVGIAAAYKWLRGLPR